MQALMSITWMVTITGRRLWQPCARWVIAEAMALQNLPTETQRWIISSGWMNIYRNAWIRSLRCKIVSLFDPPTGSHSGNRSGHIYLYRYTGCLIKFRSSREMSVVHFSEIEPAAYLRSVI